MALKRISDKPGSSERAKPRVLYVEDEDTNWEVAEHALRSTYQLTRAKTSAEAFALLQQGQFDVILMDIQLKLSDMNGIDITKALKRRQVDKLPAYARGVFLDHTPIIFVTAFAASYTREDLIASGGTDMLTKPVMFASLALMLSRLLAKNVQQQLSKP